MAGVQAVPEGAEVVSVARIRTVKPEFFLHEPLFDAERASGLPLRLAFAGLWTQADREGRFKWRTRTLKAGVLPHDDVDFAAVLDALASAGFIVAYEVDGERYGWIPSFSDHQQINQRERPSQLPEPPMVTGKASARTGSVQCEDSTEQVHARGEGKGREGKGTGKEGKETRACRDANTHPVARTIGVGNPLAEVKRQLGEVRAECTGGVLVDADWRKLMPLIQELHAKGKAHESIAAFRAFHADAYWQSRGHPVRAFVKGYSEHDAKAKSAGRPRITSNGDGAQEVAF